MPQYEMATPEQMEQLFDLRWSVLREPLGEPKGSEQDQYDDLIQYPETIHGVAVADNRIIGTGRIHRREEEPTELQVRYMVTSPDYRGQGIGERVLAHMQLAAMELPAVETIMLYAREQAVTLYQRAGFTAVSDVIELHGLPHIQMRRAFKSGDPDRYPKGGSDFILLRDPREGIYALHDGQYEIPEWYGKAKYGQGARLTRNGKTVLRAVRPDNE